MVVFSAVTGHISPELYNLVPGTETSDKATFISLLAKAPYPELAEASVQVSTTPDDDGVVVHGEWTHVAKIKQLLQTWMEEYGPVCIKKPDTSVKCSDVKNPTVSVDGDCVKLESELESEHELCDQAKSIKDIAVDGTLRNKDAFQNQTTTSSASDVDHTDAVTDVPTDQFKVDETLEDKPLKPSTGRPRGRPRRKGRPRKSKALPMRRARSVANNHNQAIMREETEATASGNDSENATDSPPLDELDEDDYEDLDEATDLDKRDSVECEVIDFDEHQKKVVHVNDGYMCTQCGRTANSEKNALDHIARMHGEKKFRCRLCTKVYALPKDLQVHMAVHRKKFQCDVCNKMFATRYLMQGHRRRRHENPRKRKPKPKEEDAAYACKHCSYIGKRLRHLQDHELRIHGERKFSCPICDKTYAVSKELKQHMRTHSEQFCCEMCGRILKSRYAMKLHMDIQHKGLPRKQSSKTHLCTLCGMMLPNKTKYVIHQNKEHFNIRPYTCETCGMSFFAKANLKDHYKVHEDRRDYSCDICGKAFKMRQNLKMHLIIHAENRPYKCEVCDKTFTQNAALKRHARIHTGERPFQCHMCTTSFNDYSILTRHMQGIHRIDHYKFDKDKNWITPPGKDEKDGRPDFPPTISSHEKEYGCFVCGHSFSKEIDLKRHIQSQHDNIASTMDNLDRNIDPPTVYPSETEARSMYLPYIPPSHTQDGLSESANKVASALNTLAHELAIARTAAPISQQPEHRETNSLPGRHDGDASSHSDMMTSPVGGRLSVSGNSDLPVPILVVDPTMSSNMLPVSTAADMTMNTVNRQWPPAGSLQPVAYTNAVYPVSPPINSVPNFPNHHYQQP